MQELDELLRLELDVLMQELDELLDELADRLKLDDELLDDELTDDDDELLDDDQLDQLEELLEFETEDDELLLRSSKNRIDSLPPTFFGPGNCKLPVTKLSCSGSLVSPLAAVSTRVAVQT